MGVGWRGGRGSSGCSLTVLSCHHPAAVEHTGSCLSFIAKPPLSIRPQIPRPPPPPPFFLFRSFLPGFPRNLMNSVSLFLAYIPLSL